MERAATLLLRYRAGVLLVLFAITCGLAPGVINLGFDYGIESFLETDDPELARQKEHYERFSFTDTLIYFGFEADEPLGDEALACLRELTRGVTGIAGVERVTTVLTAPGLGGLDPPRLRARVRSSRLYRRLLVADPAPGKPGAVAGMIELTRDTRQTEARRRILGAIDAVVARLPAVDGKPPRLWFAGFPVLRDTYVRLVKSDQRLFLPVGAVLTTLLLFLLVPGIGLALATLAVVPGMLLWTFGTLGHLGANLVLVTSTLPTLLMVIAVADAVHLGLRYREERLAGADLRAAAAAAVRWTFVPCLLTSVTTVIGFGSLCLASIPDLVQLGAFAVLGIVIAFLLTVTLMPALLPTMARTPAHDRGLQLALRFGRLSRRLGALPSGPVLAVAGLVIGTAAALASNVRQDSFLTEDLWPDSEVSRSIRFFETRFVGPVTGELLVEPKAGGLFEKHKVAELRDFLTWVEEQDGVIRTLSFVDALDDGVPAPALGFLRAEPLGLFDADMKTARVITFMTDVGAAATERYVETLRARAAELGCS